MSLETWKLSASPFLADLGAGERSVWRFLLALFGGMLAFVLVSIVAVLLTFAVFVLGCGWPAPTSLDGARALAQRFTDLAGSDGRSFSDALQIIGFALPSNVLPIFAFIGVAAVAHGRSLRQLATSAPRFRWRMLLAGLVLSVLVIGPFLALAQLMDPKAQPPPVLTVAKDGVQRAIYVALCIVGFTPAAIGEEILFRGWLLRQSSSVTRNPVVLLIFNGVIFAAAHFDFAPDAFLERAIMGAGLGYMTLRLGGVEMSSGVHAANNLMIVLFLEPLTLKLTPNTGLDPGTMVAYVGLFVAYVGMAELMARWTPLRQWTQAQAPPPSIVEAEHFS
jgi:membrane protease YdiL (CAAX protease family)